MKPWLRNTLSGFVAALGIAATCICVILQKRQDAQVVCKKVDVHFCDKLELVNEGDIKSYIDYACGPVNGAPLDSIGLNAIEKALDMRGPILKSEVWTTLDGTLHVSVRQREPMVRFQNGSKGFYMDETGFEFPLSPSYTADVPVVEGPLADIPEWKDGLLEMVKIMTEDGWWPETISRILSGENGEIKLIPASGNEVFDFGMPEHQKVKFGKIGTYYNKIVPALNKEKAYTSVSLKYKEKIICR